MGLKDLSGAVKLLAQAQLGNTLATIYTPPAYPPNAYAMVTTLWICNTENAAHTFTLRVGAASTAAANSLFEAADLAAKKTQIETTNTCLIVIPNGMVLQGLADAAAKVTVTIFGEEIAT